MDGERIDEKQIPPLLARFYQRVRKDTQLGPVFETIIEDWDEHFARLEDFWSSVMLTSGRYKGNPLAVHVRHADRIPPEMFARWLELWRQTTSEMVSPALASEMQIKAGRIAERLAFAMHGSNAVPSPIPAAAQPYRITAIFDETTVPGALLKAHCTKAGVWGLIRVIAGRILYAAEERGGSATTLDSTMPGLIRPQEPHHVGLLGPVRFQVEFFDRDPGVAYKCV